jgi:hypothetical protein
VGPRCCGGSAEEEGAPEGWSHERTGPENGGSSSMVELAGKEEKMGKRLNEHGFVKRDT